MGEREIEGRLVARDTRAMGETRAVLAWDNGRGRSARVGVVAVGGAAEALGRLVIGRPVRVSGPVVNVIWEGAVRGVIDARGIHTRDTPGGAWHCMAAAGVASPFGPDGWAE